MRELVTGEAYLHLCFRSERAIVLGRNVERNAMRKKISFRASDVDVAKEALTALTKRYGQYDAAEADVIVALGGDGFMLETLGNCIFEVNYDYFYGVPPFLI